MEYQLHSQLFHVEKFSEGMMKLRTAALLQIIAWVLVVAAIFAGYGAILAYLGASFAVEPGHGVEPGMAGHMGVALGALAGIIVAGLVGAILLLVSTYGYLLPAASAFAEYDRSRYGTVSTLLKVGYLGGLIALIAGIAIAIGGAAALMPGFIIVGVIIIIIGAILFLVGEIGLILLMFKLHEETGDSVFMVAGILFIIGIFISFLAIVAWILVYVAAKPEARPIRAPAYSGSDILPPPPPA